MLPWNNMEAKVCWDDLDLWTSWDDLDLGTTWCDLGTTLGCGAGWYYRLVGMEDCTVGGSPGTTFTTLERPLQRVPGGFLGSIPSLNYEGPRANWD